MIFLCLMAADVGAEMALHGKLKTGADSKYNFFVSIINAALTAALLWWGGFWG